MVAASIQGLAFASHGTSTPPVLITASSQGSLMSAMVRKVLDEARSPRLTLIYGAGVTAHAEVIPKTRP